MITFILVWTFIGISSFWGYSYWSKDMPHTNGEAVHGTLMSALCGPVVTYHAVMDYMKKTIKKGNKND